MLNIALINPYTPDGNFVPPLGLLTIAAILEKQGHGVAVFDQTDEEDIVGSVKAFSPDLIGLTAVTSAVLAAKRLASELKEEISGSPIIFGGPHPSSLPEEVAAWPEVDFVVAGEGEKAMTLLVRWLENNGTRDQLDAIPNLYYGDGERIVATPRIPFLNATELDALPLPAYHLLDIDRIASRIRHGLFRKGSRVLPYMASRGCPHRCTFCCRMMGRAVRRKSADLVLDDIEFLVRTYDLDGIYIEDDNFTSSHAYAMQILNGIIDRKLPISIKFANGVRVDTLTDELLATMRRAGCHSLGFGLESGSARVLQLMEKRLDLEVVRGQVEKIRSHGYLVGANMILGYPGETEDDIWESYDFFQSLGLDSVAVVNLIPFPDTAVRSICDENGFLTPEAASWDNYYFDIKDPKILIATDQLPADVLRRLLKKVFFKLYADRRRVMTLLRNMTPADMVAGARLFAQKLFQG